MSIDIMEFVMRIEKEFDVEIQEEDYESLGTVGSLCEYIQQRSAISDPDIVWKTVRRIASEEFHIPHDEINLTSRWVEDLKLD